jgi:spermidine synthase
VLGLLARQDDAGFDAVSVRMRLAAASRPDAAMLGIADEFALFGSFVAGPRALARIAQDAPLNTDDHPIVAYLAPRITYAPDSRPRDRLLELLAALAVAPEELVGLEPEPGWSARLAAYWRARDRYLEVGRDVQPSSDARRMLAQVREPLLGVLRVSPDFRPAYDPLVALAQALAVDDAAGGLTLLAELDRLQPARPEAREAMARLAAGPGGP